MQVLKFFFSCVISQEAIVRGSKPNKEEDTKSANKRSDIEKKQRGLQDERKTQDDLKGSL